MNSPCISEPVCIMVIYLLFKFIIRNPSFSDQFQKIIKLHCLVGHNNIMRQSACLVVNPSRTLVEWLGKPRDVNKRFQSLAL